MNFSASIYQTCGNLRSSDIYSDDELGFGSIFSGSFFAGVARCVNPS